MLSSTFSAKSVGRESDGQKPPEEPEKTEHNTACILLRRANLSARSIQSQDSMDFVCDKLNWVNKIRTIDSFKNSDNKCVALPFLSDS